MFVVSKMEEIGKEMSLGVVLHARSLLETRHVRIRSGAWLRM